MSGSSRQEKARPRILGGGRSGGGWPAFQPCQVGEFQRWALSAGFSSPLTMAGRAAPASSPLGVSAPMQGVIGVTPSTGTVGRASNSSVSVDRLPPDPPVRIAPAEDLW